MNTRFKEGDQSQPVGPDFAGPAGGSLLSLELPLLREVQLNLHASLGDLTLSVADLLALKIGSVVKLDAKITDLIDIHLNDTLVARGELVSVDDNFGVRIVEIVRHP